jgi:hypothetical protein
MRAPALARGHVIPLRHRCLRVALHAARAACALFMPPDDSSPSAGGSKSAAAQSACLCVRISHAAVPYIIIQLLELLQMKDKSVYYFNSGLMKAFLSDSLVTCPPSPTSSMDDDDDAALPPPPSKRRTTTIEVQLECSAGIAEKVLRLADLRNRNLQTFVAAVTRELELEAHLADVKSRDPELRTKRAKKIIKIQALQKMVLQQLECVDSILPLLQSRSTAAMPGACHVTFLYDCLLDLRKGGGGAWQGLTFQIAYATPQSSAAASSAPVWEEVAGGGIYDVSQQTAPAAREMAKVLQFSFLPCTCFAALRFHSCARRSRTARASAAATAPQAGQRARCCGPPRCAASACTSGCMSAAAAAAAAAAAQLPPQHARAGVLFHSDLYRFMQRALVRSETVIPLPNLRTPRTPASRLACWQLHGVRGIS